MKKLIVFAISCICASMTLSAQSKTTTNSNLKLQEELKLTSISHSTPAKLGLVSVVLKPDAKLILSGNVNTPVENAGKSLTRAGRYLYWGTVATVFGQIFTILGEPTAGTLLTLGGTVVVYMGYSQITQAGKQLQQTANE